MADLKTTDRPWDGSASRWPDTKAYCQSSLINENDDSDPDTWVQAKCHLPIYEPDGTLNLNALGPAVGALAGARGSKVSATPASRKKAAQQLKSIYQQLNRPLPDTIKNMA